MLYFFDYKPVLVVKSPQLLELSNILPVDFVEVDQSFDGGLFILQ